MSSYGSPDCPICGAHSDYCHLDTPVGVSIDCRDLQLRDPRDAEWIASMRDAIRKVGKNASDIEGRRRDRLAPDVEPPRSAGHTGR